MNSVSFFYKVFAKQELILKLNNVHFNKQIDLLKCLVFKKVKSGDNDKKSLQNVNNDLRYVLEFLTNSKINNATGGEFSIKINLNFESLCNLFLCFSYLIFSRSNFVLESKSFEHNYPKIKKVHTSRSLSNKKTIDYLDINFTDGFNLNFLSDNSYTSYVNFNQFSLRFVFKHLSTDNFFQLKQYLYLSVIGFKFVLIESLIGKHKY